MENPIDRTNNIKYKIYNILKFTHTNYDEFEKCYKLVTNDNNIILLLVSIAKDFLDATFYTSPEYYEDLYYEIEIIITQAYRIHLQYMSEDLINECNINYLLMPTINFPLNFIFWTKEFFTDTLIDYYNNNNIVYSSFINNINDYINKDKLKNFMLSYYIKYSKEKLIKYEKELIEKTWHPDRLFNWCLDECEKKDFINSLD